MTSFTRHVRVLIRSGVSFTRTCVNVTAASDTDRALEELAQDCGERSTHWCEKQPRGITGWPGSLEPFAFLAPCCPSVLGIRDIVFPGNCRVEKGGAHNRHEHFQFWALLMKNPLRYQIHDKTAGFFNTAHRHISLTHDTNPCTTASCSSNLKCLQVFCVREWSFACRNCTP